MFTEFTTEYLHIIDDNNRLAIPSPLRKCIDETKDGKGFYMAYWRCLLFGMQFIFQE